MVFKGGRLEIDGRLDIVTVGHAVEGIVEGDIDDEDVVV